MTMIGPEDESERDWDWYAVDPEGKVGHFTTAGIRSLPRTVKRDKEAALRLIDYFFEEAPKSSPYEVRPDAETDSGGWADDASRSRYLKDFIEMASAGLYSYDTYTSGANADYFLVAFPKTPLCIDQLPPEIRDLVRRTKSTFSFTNSAYISERDTRDW